MTTGHPPVEIGSMQWWADRRERIARRRPRADGLTVERIIEAALALVDREGIEGLTVRRLADELGTGSASLYRHVASRRELLVLVADHVLGDVRFPPGDLAGRQKVERLATELRRVLLGHPNLLPALQVAPLVGPNAMRGAERGIAYLLEAGVDLEAALPACFALIDFVLGTVFFETSTTAQAPHRRRRRADGVGDDAAAGGSRPALPVPTADDIFSFGLTMLLDGLSSRYPPAG
jgi:TetR/AcrR family tetracycline transcriptional repressor